MQSEVRDQVISTLRAHASEFREIGVAGLALFGSTARGDRRPQSDVDLLVRLNPSSRMGLFAFVRLERRVRELLHRDVQLVSEPIEDSRFRSEVNRDRVTVF